MDTNSRETIVRAQTRQMAFGVITSLQNLAWAVDELDSIFNKKHCKPPAREDEWTDIWGEDGRDIAADLGEDKRRLN